ncbi:uncharacterized protein LOC111025146 isoform X2 [Momordica charantia]|uniref:Uncharacterized protein LOC111025146 isoform X2 n=1 Tax=Momordica charantia TaxID=3673 RepID=A0A6J1DWI3_MOMCH|nr:uncharacterized protein LOC111025146 isoform X2 [Momordica charantia]
MASSSCSLRTADFKVSRLDVSRERVSTSPPCTLRNWIGRTLPQYSGLVISHLSRKVALHACSSTSPETQTITRLKRGSEETKVSSLASQLIPNLHEVEILLTNICDTSSITEFELRLSGFDLHMVRGLKIEDVPPPLAHTPAPASQNASSVGSDLNGSGKTTSLALFKAEPVSSSPAGISRFVEKATDEGLAILQSPKVGIFRRSRTIKGKRAPPSCKESDISGEVVKILRKDGEPVGYGDALIAVLPSFPGIKKLQ